MKKSESFPMIRVTSKFKELAEQRASSMGLSLTDYIRYLIQKDIDEYNNNKV